MKGLIVILTFGIACFVAAQEEETPATDAPVTDSAQTTESTVKLDSTASEKEEHDLIIAPASQWARLKQHLDFLKIAIDSMSAVGVAFDRASKNLVIITLEPDGSLGRTMINTPAWLYDTITTQEIQTVSKVPDEETHRQEGRAYFIVNTTIRATGVYPTSLALALPHADERVITGVALLTFGGSLYGSYAFTRKMELGYGRVAMMNYGGELGIYYPILASLIASDQGETYYAPRIAGWGMTFGFPLGVFAGSRVNFVGNHEYGNAAIMRHFGRIGLSYGFTIPLLWAFETDFKYYRTVSAAISMGLIPAGFYLGNVIVGDRSYSAGRSALVVIAGTIAAATGAIIPTWWEAETEELHVAMGLAGSVGGTILGFRYHEPREYGLWQGVFMGISATVGSGIGMSIPFIAKADDHRAYTIPAVAGAWGGLFLGEFMSTALFERSPRDRPEAAARVDIPVAWEWPSLVYAALFNKSDSRGIEAHVDLVRVAF